MDLATEGAAPPSPVIVARRYHDFSCGHRVHGHESKCAHLHGHNYRVTFTLQAPKLDSVGRVLDFSAIKDYLCEWLEQNWDHKFLAWAQDTYMGDLLDAFHNGAYAGSEAARMFENSLVLVPFNPTAENMALYLLEVVAPQLLPDHCKLIHVRVEETRKCAAEVYL